MIRVRRVAGAVPLLRLYELQIAGSIADSRTTTARRGIAVRRLEKEVGTGDAWSFLRVADVAWDRGDRSWAVEYEPPA